MKKKLLIRDTKYDIPDFNKVLKKCVLLFMLCAFYFTSNAQQPTCDNYGNGDADNVVYTVNGSVVSSLAGLVSGDHVQICFTVTTGTPTLFSLVSYTCPGASFDENTASLQTIFDVDSHTFSGSGIGCLSVTIPSCYFQIDFVKGCVISQLGPAGSNNFYGEQGRLIVSINGGSGSCNCVASANASADISLDCSETQTTLSGSTYTHSPVVSWQAINGGHITAGINTLTPTVNATGTYVLTVFDTLGCSVTDSVNVTVPSLMVNLGHDTTLCEGSSLMLNAGNPGLNFLWSTGAISQTLTITTSGSYYVSVMNGTCMASDTIHVTVVPLPIVDLGSDITVTSCAGSVHLDAGNAGMSYLWSTGASTQTISVTSSGTYYVDVMNSNNCMASDTIHVIVNPVSLNVDLGNDTILCAGGSMTLDAGNAGLGFMWSTGASTQTITVTASGTYYVSVINGSCIVTDSVHVTVLPEIHVNLGNDTTVVLCSGSITLNAGNPVMNYIWNTGAHTQTIDVGASGTYYVTVVNGIGCMASDTIHVTINPGSLTINLGRDTTIMTCSHETLTLDAGITGAAYVWNTEATSQTNIAATTGIYYVNVLDNLGCTASDTISVTIIDHTIDLNLGSDTTVCGCILLNAGAAGATSYNWCNGADYALLNVCTSGMYCVTVSNGMCMNSDTIHVTIDSPPVVHLGNDTVLVNGTLTLNAGNAGAIYLWNTGAVTQTINVTVSGTYYVSVTNISGCTVTDTININSLTGIADNAGNTIIDIYPNPTNGLINIGLGSLDESEAIIKISSLLGEVVFLETTIPKQNITKILDMKGYEKGIYFLTIQSANQLISKKIILQ